MDHYQEKFQCLKYYIMFAKSVIPLECEFLSTKICQGAQAIETPSDNFQALSAGKIFRIVGVDDAAP